MASRTRYTKGVVAPGRKSKTSARSRRKSSLTAGEHVSPRKQPASSAGVAINDAILDAAEVVIEEHGLEGLTTNRVAERAGVSIGSLYQYYPNKAAILAETARRHEVRSQRVIVQALQTHRKGSAGEVAASVVDVMLGDEIGSRSVRRALRSVVPSDWTSSTSHEVDTELRSLVRDELATRKDVREGNHDLMAFVVAHAIEHLVETAVQNRPELLDSDAFRQELVTLIVRYLAPE